MGAANRHTGFTIVELLIVIVVIAILAALTLVAFNGVQSRARVSQLTSSLEQSKRKLELYKIDNSAYPLTGNLASAGISNANSVTYQYTSDGTTYCLTASSGGVSYNNSNSSGATSGACSGQVSGGIITNLVYNPGAANNVSGFSSWGGGGGGVTTVSSQPVGWSASGRAARATWTANNTTYNGDIGWHIGSTGTYGYLEENTQYTVSWKVSTSKAQRIAPVIGVAAVANGAQGSGTATANATSGNAVTTANSPIEQWVTFTTGPSTVSIKAYSALVSGTGAVLWNSGDYMEVSDFMWVKGSTKHAFASGASPGWSWSGSAHASTSSGPPL